MGTPAEAKLSFTNARLPYLTDNTMVLRSLYSRFQSISSVFGSSLSISLVLTRNCFFRR